MEMVDWTIFVDLVLVEGIALEFDLNVTVAVSV